MYKNVKKLMSLFISAIMVLSAFVVTVSAEDSDKTQIGISSSSEFTVGEEFILTISINNAVKLTHGSLEIDYEPDCFEFIGIEQRSDNDFALACGALNESTLGLSFLFKDAFSGDKDFADIKLIPLTDSVTDISVRVTQWDSSKRPDDIVFNLSDVEDVPVKVEDVHVKFDYEIADGQVTITDCDITTSGEVIIPAEIDGYPVTVIGNDAFANCDGITSIVIPDSVKTIEDFAFSGCDGLTTATISSGVTTLGCNIFWNCENLENVVIKNGVTYISKEMFAQCWKLKSVSIPESVITIGAKAFECCYLLEKIDFPDKLTTIEESAFYMCESLDNVVIPDYVTAIATYTFYSCSNLKNISLSKNIETIDEYAFAESGVGKINIPYGVTSIGRYAFAESKLESISIPGSITLIREGTFSNCSKLTDVAIPKTVTTIERYAFLGCSSLKSMVIPASVKEIGYQAVGYKDNMYHQQDSFKISGVNGSEAQRYASSNRLGYISVDDIAFDSDVDGSGKITAADARLALRVSANLATLSGIALLAADADANGKVTAADARLILRKSAGL